MLVRKVGQLWYRSNRGEEFPYSNKFYSKIGTATNLAKKYNKESAFEFFVKVFELEFVGTIEGDKL